MIIEIDFSGNKTEPFFIKKEKDSNLYCLHRKILVDEKLRQLECEQCGQVIDAYDYVLKWANEEKRFFAQIEMLKNEQSALQNHRDALKKEIISLKSKLKTASKKAENVHAMIEKKDQKSCINEIREKLK